MSSFRLHCTYGLLIACCLGLLLYQALPFFRTTSPLRISDLHGLAFHLRQKGLILRGVPSRGDGLWLNAIYLTNTEQNDTELHGLTVHPNKINQWKGTVIVFSDEANWPHDTKDWGENGLHWGHFVFFGDKELLTQIVEALGNLGND